MDIERCQRYAELKGWTVSWADDWDVDHEAEFDCYTDGGPSTCEVAMLQDRHGNTLASLGCIDDATDDYRREIAADLVMEAVMS